MLLNPAFLLYHFFVKDLNSIVSHHRGKNHLCSKIVRHKNERIRSFIFLSWKTETFSFITLKLFMKRFLFCPLLFLLLFSCKVGQHRVRDEQTSFSRIESLLRDRNFFAARDSFQVLLGQLT